MMVRNEEGGSKGRIRDDERGLETAIGKWSKERTGQESAGLQQGTGSWKERGEVKKSRTSFWKEGRKECEHDLRINDIGQDKEGHRTNPYTAASAALCHTTPLFSVFLSA